VHCEILIGGRTGKPTGFTFLEVLVALCVVSISIVALLNAHSISMRNSIYSQTISRATLLAEERINEIESKGLTQIDEEEFEEYENGLRYVVELGEFYDPEETEINQPEWRQDYWWRTTIEDTEYTYVQKVVVEVFLKKEEKNKPWSADPWEDEQVIPQVTLVTYIASTNRREDARSGSTATPRTSRQRSR